MRNQRSYAYAISLALLTVIVLLFARSTAWLGPQSDLRTDVQNAFSQKPAQLKKSRGKKGSKKPTQKMRKNQKSENIV